MPTYEAEALSNLPLFRDLTVEQLEGASKLLRPNSAPPGTALMKHNEPGDEIFILISGAVKVCVPDTEGRVTVVHIGGPGEVLGEMSVLDGENRSATVIVLEQCGYFTINSHDFWNTLWMFPPVPFNMLSILNRRMRFATRQLHAMRYVAPATRVSRQLGSLFDEFGLTNGQSIYLPFRISISDLASLAGVRQEDVASVLKTAHEKGLLGADVIGRFTTRDIPGLRSLVE